jgi:cardiolipin synthase (CMP-forming)
MPRWINAPNLLTLLRLALCPWIIQSIAAGRHWQAITLFACAAITDVADGAAARRLKLTTQVGAYLDPIADKCLLSGVFLALAWTGAIPWWLVGVIFGRDLYILAGVGLMMAFKRKREFPPSVWGKISTFVQILTAAAWLSHLALGEGVTGAIASVAVWPCACSTLWSGAHYTWLTFVTHARIDAVSARE